MTFALHLTLLGGSITAWVFTSKYLALKSEKDHQTPFGQPFQNILAHIIFTAIILAQLVLLERRLFRLREERYNYIYHGVSCHRNIPRSMTSAFAPWNHPSLPTYAVALSQGGVATGDVEDHIIACPPPPSYNNTRGSTLALSGFSRNRLSCESDTGGPLNCVSRESKGIRFKMQKGYSD